ncbi:MAG: hypothetical protein AAF597_18335 [Bacteroidota bacterium]
MPTPFFSIVGFLNQPIHTPNGEVVGTLIDIIGDERTGSFTYFLLEGHDAKLYAIHHSYFYHLSFPSSLVFDQNLGDDDQDLFIDLPAAYQDVDICSLTELLHSAIPNLVMAEHISDDEPPC